MAIVWSYQSFDQLTSLELYAILQLRNEVFVVEQQCPYQDADQKDIASYHLCCWNNSVLAAYCRILPPGLAFTEASIGRVATAAALRKAGFGRALMQRAIKATLTQFDCQKITISAQLYLKKFYQSLDFEQISATYLEDGIAHIEMRYST